MSQAAQPGPGQPQGQHRMQHIFRPEEMRNLPPQLFSENDRLKYEKGLMMLWKQRDENPQGSPASMEATKKLSDFSKTLTAKIEAARAAQGQAQQSGMAGQSQNSQAPNPHASSQGQMQQQQQPQQRPGQPSAALLDHINRFRYVLPSQYTAGTPEGNQWLQEAKNRYGKALMAMENAKVQLKSMEQAVKDRHDQGNPLTEDEQKQYIQRKDLAIKKHTEAKQYVENFRRSQTEQLQAQNALAQQSGQGQQIQQSGHSNSGGQIIPPRPPMNTQQVPTPQQQQQQQLQLQQQQQQAPQQQLVNPAVQNTQTVNAAIEAARNQMNGARAQVQPNAGAGASGQQQQQPQQQQQQQNVPNVSGQPGQPQASTAQSVAQQMMANHAIKVETNMQNNMPPAQPGVANTPLSATIRPQHRQSQGTINSPQSAHPQSAAANDPGRPLSHSAALSQAARTYSSASQSGGGSGGGAAPSVMGSHSHPSIPREAQNNRMPIPRDLPERATAPPVPVAMQSGGRPTMTGGPSNVGSGVMGQPVLQKAPGFNLEGEGERVMNKKKLDELVRQVTGGGESLENGEGLTAEVEETILQVADEFVDQVITAACKLAKARGSTSLEIRDIQLILERNYNIRIPGYASDEIRTVRKFQPAQGWVAKMSAVQAAKVTGGKSEL